MNNDMSHSSVTVYTARRRNKSIWMRSCLVVALVVAMLTSYALIFPARTVNRELICDKQEHTHTDDCWLTALTCGMEEGEEHTHTSDCYTTVCICGMEEHVHTDACYAELETLPPAETTTEAPTEAATEPADPETEPPMTEPAAVTEPDEPTVPTTDSAQPDEPTDPVQTEPDDTEPTVTEPVGAEPDGTEPAGTEPAGTEPVETEPVETEPAETEPEDAEPNRGDEPGWWEPYEENGIDLTPYLESAIFRHEKDGALIEETVFTSGETVKAAIEYDIPEGIVTLESKYVYYQLPEGIAPIEETSGEVMDNGVAVGIYTITEEGKIHILFNDEFANGNDIVGTVEFSCFVFANEDDSDRIVDFGDDVGTITIITPKEYDLGLEKEGRFTDYSYRQAEYLLTVYTENGTGEPIEITDQLINLTPDTLSEAVYNQDPENFSVVYVDAEGNETELSDYTVEWDESNMHFALSLPALEADEFYRISYLVDLEPDFDGDFSLKNTSTATAGELAPPPRNTTLNYRLDISKRGEYDDATGLVRWEIMINPSGGPVARWRILDQLPAPAAGGPILLLDADKEYYATIGPEGSSRIDYTFPNRAKAQVYYVTYSTEPLENAGTISNTVHLIKPDDVEITVVSEVEVGERTEELEKLAGAAMLQSNGLLKADWSFRITLPSKDLERYEFTDKIREEENAELLHYGYVAELEAALRGNLRLVGENEESWVYGDPQNEYVSFELEYYDFGGNLITDLSDAESPVDHFKVRLTPLQGGSFRGYQIVADSYYTWIDVSELPLESQISYRNKLLANDKSSEARGTFIKSEAFAKQVRVGRIFSDSNVTINYADCGGVLEFRLVLNLDYVFDGGFTVTDVLPEGVELVEDSPRAYFLKGSSQSEHSSIFAQGENFRYETGVNGDGAATVTFIGSGITDALRDTYSYVCVVYRLRLTDESVWNEYTNDSRTFVNSACWGDFSDSLETTVHIIPTRLEKTGAQIITDGTAQPTIRFSLLINAGAEDLNPAGDTITLTDSFSGIDSRLILSSIRLYEYDPSRPDKLGNLVRPSKYSLSYNEATNQMEVVLPDEAAYVMVYDYNIIDFQAILDGVTTVSNYASLEGQFHSESEIVLKGLSSSATAYQRVVVFTKVDERNFGKVLKDARFLLEYWDVPTNSWVQVFNEEDGLDENDPDHGKGYFVTDEHGEIILSMLGSNADISVSRLYRLTEMKAPVGYEGEGTEVCFICRPNTAVSNAELYSQAAEGSEIPFDSVQFFSFKGGTFTITNPFTGLTVEKRWFENGIEMAKPMRNYIDVTLYVSTDPTGETGMTQVPADEKVRNPVRITAQDGWSYTWEDLPTTDADGNLLYYFVEEDPILGFTATYINNGITGGTIDISNDCEPYVLPETGGLGTKLFVGLGVVFMSLTAIVYIKINYKKLEEKQ